MSQLALNYNDGNVDHHKSESHKVHNTENTDHLLKKVRRKEKLTTYSCTRAEKVKTTIKATSFDILALLQG